MASRPRKPRPEPAPTTPDAIEIAMEAEAKDTSANSPARQVLLEQVRLLRIQRRSETLGAALKVLMGLAGVAAAAALAVMAWNAHKASGIVIEPFAVPPELAARGLTGEVVAAQVLDELQAMRAASSRSGNRSFQANTDQKLRVAIPSTGVSIGDLQQALRHWLGSEIHVSGEVYRQAGGVVMRARTGSGELVTIRGDEDHLQSLALEAAKAVYRQTQPDGYAWWLFGRDEDSAAAAQVNLDAAEQAPDAKTRAYLLIQACYWTQWADLRRAGELCREALRLDPRLLAGHSQLAAVENTMGHSEVASRARTRAIKDDRNGAAPALPFQNKGVIANNFRDHPTVLRMAELAGSDQATSRYMGTQIDQMSIRALSGLHETTQALRWAAAPKHLHASRGDGDKRRLEAYRLSVLYEASDWPALAAQDPMLPLAFLPTETLRRIPSLPFGQVAEAKARTGDLAGAKQMIDQTPLDCDRCVIARGWIAQVSGDTRTAEHWFAEAARMMPTLPDAVAAQGQARVERGDFQNALAPLREARKRAPRWADPLKFEGDALTGLGQPKQALAKYAAAARLAPKWGGLYLAWGEALARLGKTDEARTKWRTASGLDLTPAERARLAAHLGGKS